jgi:hypothetical protein
MAGPYLGYRLCENDEIMYYNMNLKVDWRAE